MNRRKFFALLGIGAVSAVVPRAVAEAAPKTPSAINVPVSWDEVFRKMAIPDPKAEIEQSFKEQERDFLDTTGYAHIFSRPEKGYDYVIGVWVGEPTVFSVWRKGKDNLDPFVQAMEVQQGRGSFISDTEWNLETAVSIAKIYGEYLPDGPLFSIEQAMSQGDTLQHFLKIKGFRRFHKTVHYRPDAKQKEGWYSTAWFRPITAERFLIAHEGKWITVNSNLLRSDLGGAGFSTLASGKKVLILPNATTDHRFMAAAIAYHSSCAWSMHTEFQQKIASDTADKMLESIGPIGKEIAERVEKNNPSTGQAVKNAIYQWFNKHKTLT